MNATDRCDRCGAQAKARFVLGEQDLLFCGHHTQEYRVNLVIAGFQNEQYMAEGELIPA